jgi:hypothetical protein
VKRSVLLIAVLLALLACSASLPPGSAQAAPSAGGAGHNPPTRKLEAAFKIAGFERAADPNGCFPAPGRLVALVRKRTKVKVALGAGFGSVRREGVVYVLRRRTNCNRLVEALRDGAKVFVLDSVRGPVYVKGQGGKATADESGPGARGPLRALSFATKSTQIGIPEQTKRLEVLCPKGKFPLGGGMTASPTPDPDGEGAYPHSYERLGAQRGWHVNPVMIDPSPGQTTPRRVTVQVLCGKGVAQSSGPRKTVFLRPGQTKTAIARCPGNQKLFSGGFQRTNFRTPGGDYITESRAVGNAWQVTGHAFGLFGGELTAMAYCARKKNLRLTEVSDSTTLASGAFATATTPTCPPGQQLTSGGFSANGSQDAFFADGSLNPNGTWSASGFGFFGAAPNFTAYGYCLST